VEFEITARRDGPRPGGPVLAEEKPGHVEDEDSHNRQDHKDGSACYCHDLCTRRLDAFGAILNSLMSIGLPLNQRQLITLKCQELLLVVADLFQCREKQLSVLVIHSPTSYPQV